MQKAKHCPRSDIITGGRGQFLILVLDSDLPLVIPLFISCRGVEGHTKIRQRWEIRWTTLKLWLTFLEVIKKSSETYEGKQSPYFPKTFTHTDLISLMSEYFILENKTASVQGHFFSCYLGNMSKEIADSSLFPWLSHCSSRDFMWLFELHVPLDVVCSVKEPVMLSARSLAHNRIMGETVKRVSEQVFKTDPMASLENTQKKGWAEGCVWKPIRRSFMLVATSLPGSCLSSHEQRSWHCIIGPLVSM